MVFKSILYCFMMILLVNGFLEKPLGRYEIDGVEYLCSANCLVCVNENQCSECQYGYFLLSLNTTSICVQWYSNSFYLFFYFDSPGYEQIKSNTPSISCYECFQNGINW